MILSENYTVLHFEGDTMKWWEVLKNAKISGKAKGKGTSFDASKVKINIDDKDDCCEEFWKTIQEFKNEHLVVFKVMININSNRPSDDGDKFPTHSYDGIGHMYYEGDTLISPMSSDKPCRESRRLFSLIKDIQWDITGSRWKESAKVWKEFGNHVTGRMYPFLPRHYLKSNLRHVNEWPILVNKFLEEYDDLWRKYEDCEKLRE